MKLIPCLFLIFLVACASRIEEQDNLLQTESYTLTKADLLALSPEFGSEEDSIKWVKTFLKSWKRDRSFLESAQKILESSELDFEKQIEDYIYHLIKTKNISRSTQNQVINSIKFYYEKVLGFNRELYQINRPRKERKLPEVFSQEEVIKI